MKECGEGGDEGRWSRGMVKDDGEGGEEEWIGDICFLSPYKAYIYHSYHYSV